jgi:DNA-binding transcriptional MerR regulator
LEETTLTIRQHAEPFSLKPSAIRSYEATGRLPEPPRESGQRRRRHERGQLDAFGIIHLGGLAHRV